MIEFVENEIREHVCGCLTRMAGSKEEQDRYLDELFCDYPDINNFAEFSKHNCFSIYFFCIKLIVVLYPHLFSELFRNHNSSLFIKFCYHFSSSHNFTLYLSFLFPSTTVCFLCRVLPPFVNSFIHTRVPDLYSLHGQKRILRFPYACMSFLFH